MIRETVRILARSPETVIKDILGIVAIFVIMFAGLNFPGLT